ncbi:MAG: ABC transporter ATP-binding protein [Fimbriimonadaceae bacterium]
MIELVNASRWYGQVIGLNDVTCTIGPGMTALLGMNGAGKSTMLRMITGQIRATTGQVLVNGMEPFANKEIYKSLGYCPEIDNFYEQMTGRQFVNYLARLGGFGPSEAKARTHSMLERVGMAQTADRWIAGYSKGMRQRIKLAQAMVHDPQIILLDEPLNGLDPLGRREFIEVLGDLADRGCTIIVSSHILYEVERMTRNLLLLHRGRLLAVGDLRMIRGLIDNHPHQIRLETSEPRRAAELLAALPNVVSLRFTPAGDAVEFECTEPDKLYDALPQLVLDKGLRISGFSSPDNNLEAVFSYLVKK